MKKRLLSLLFILSIVGVGFAQSSKHSYVDLGLPSGLLWATCNVGAEAPEECGTSFAWGETYSKSEFEWKNYKFCKDPLLSKKKLTKYCSWQDIAYKKKTDRLTVLQKVDDAAADNWGDGWRMPTKKEWKELVENTVQERTTVNGVHGFRFKAPNGKSIFLPDKRYGGGFYWSSSLADDNPTRASILYWIDQQKVHIDKAERCLGYLIRPVRDAK